MTIDYGKWKSSNNFDDLNRKWICSIKWDLLKFFLLHHFFYARDLTIDAEENIFINFWMNFQHWMLTFDARLNENVKHPQNTPFLLELDHGWPWNHECHQCKKRNFFLFISKSHIKCLLFHGKQFHSSEISYFAHWFHFRILWKCIIFF